MMDSLGSDPTSGKSIPACLGNWRRVRKSIEYENNLINYRQVIFFSAQAIVSAAFSALVVETYNPKNTFLATYGVHFLNILTVLGYTTACISWVVIDAAQRQIKRLNGWFYENYHQNERSQFPPIGGVTDNVYHKFITTKSFSHVFMFLWIALLFLNNALIVPDTSSIATTQNLSNNMGTKLRSVHNYSFNWLIFFLYDIVLMFLIYDCSRYPNGPLTRLVKFAIKTNKRLPGLSQYVIWFIKIISKFGFNFIDNIRKRFR